MREEEIKRLKRLVREVKGAPDTPAIISILAEDPELLQLAFRILTIQPAGDPALFQDLERACREAEATPALLRKRLTPAARALGLPGPEEATGDFYEVLGVSPNASAAAIRKAYLTRARDLHPDIHPDIRPQAFALLAEAYRVLSSPDLRKGYDVRQRKVDPDWAERSPGFTEAAEKKAEGHHREKRRLVFQVVLLLLVMTMGIGIATYLFEEQALREGSSVQPPSNSRGPSTAPAPSAPSPPVQVAARSEGVRGQEAGVGLPPRRAFGPEKDQTPGAGDQASQERRSEPEVPPASLTGGQVQKSAKPPPPAKTSVEPSVNLRSAPEKHVSLKEVPSPSVDPKDADDGSNDTQILAELEEMALKASRKTPVQPAQAPDAASIKPPTVQTPAPSVKQPPVEPPRIEQTTPSTDTKAPDGPDRSAPSEPPAKATIPASEEKTPTSDPPPPPVPLHQIQDFIKAYCQAYENLDFLRFMGFFAQDAVENDKSVRQLETAYRNNFERLEALTYHIDVKDCRVKPDEIEVSGHYRLRWRFHEDDWQGREGAIVLGLIPVKGSYQVKRLVYR